MAIVKVKYTRDPIKIKEHLRYIVHRPGKDRGTITRELFDAFEYTDKAHAYEHIDATKRPLFFKIILNFDAKKEDKFKDLDLQHITRRTLSQMQRLIGRDMPFVAVMHDDHTNLRHIHAIGIVQGKIAKEDFKKLKTLWLIATAEARLQRRLRDRVREHPRIRYLTQARMLTQPILSHNRYRSSKPVRIQHGCHQCGYGQITGIPSDRRYCPSCHKPLKQERTGRYELSRHV